MLEAEGFGRGRRWAFVAVAALLALVPLLPSAAQTSDATPVVTGAGGCENAPAGLLLAAPAMTQATPAPRGLAVLDPATGKTVATIDLANVVRLIPTRLPGHAIAVTIDDELYVIDVAARRATPLPLPAGVGSDLYAIPYQFSTTTGRRFLLLGDGSGQQAVLIDLQTATAHDLVAPITAAGSTISRVFGADLSPDDARVLVWDGSDAFLIETASPDTAVRLSDAGTSLRPSFSPDGRIIALPEVKNRTGTLLLFAADGTNRHSVLTGNGPLNAVWFPETPALLAYVANPAANASDLVTVDAATGETRKRAAVPFLATRAWVTPDGQRAMVGAVGDATAPWTLVDLASGQSTPLSTVTGAFVPITASPHADRVVYMPASGDVTGGAGLAYLAVDLHAGTATPLLTQEVGTLYLPPSAAPDGSALLLPVQTGDVAALWLLDAATGTATKLADDTHGAFGGFSPDGCRIAMVLYTGSGDTATTILQIADRSGAAPVELGPGRIPLWLAMG